MLTKAERLLGQTIAGYRLLEVLGRGGMSIVFLAERLDDPHNKVAIKVLVPSDFITPDEFVSFQARFLREAQAAHQMHHEHILPVLGYGEENDLFYMIIPVIIGGTLADLLATHEGPLPLPQIAGYLNQLASAIDYANAHGVVHRDIKPSNVLLDEQGNVYLVDFGIVHIFDSGPYAVDQAPTTLTGTGKLYGTPAYMAPERFRGERAEPATDIYALGVLLYLLVTGQVPFKADNPLVVGMKHLNEEPPAPRSLRPDLPEPAEAAILKALAKRPTERFATASALAAAFDAGIKGQWMPGLLPLPPVVPPYMEETQVQPQQLAPVVPVPENPSQPNPLVLGPAFASAYRQMPIADAPTEAAPPPVVFPRTRPWGRILALLTVAVLAVIVALALLLATQLLHRPSSSGPQVSPTSTSGVPIKTGATPTLSPGLTPAASPGHTPTPRSTPTPTHGVTPTPKPTSPPPTPTPTSPPPTPTPTTAPPPTP